MCELDKGRTKLCVDLISSEPYRHKLSAVDPIPIFRNVNESQSPGFLGRRKFFG